MKNKEKLLESLGFNKEEIKVFNSDVSQNMGYIYIDNGKQRLIYDDITEEAKISTQKGIESIYISPDELKKSLKLMDSGYNLSIEQEGKTKEVKAVIEQGRFKVEIYPSSDEDFKITMQNFLRGETIHYFPRNDALEAGFGKMMEYDLMNPYKFEEMFQSIAKADYDRFEEMAGPALRQKVETCFEQKEQERLSILVEEVFGKIDNITYREQDDLPQFNITETATSKMCSLTFKDDSSIGATIPNADRGDKIMIFIRNETGEPRWEEIPNYTYIAESIPELLKHNELNHQNIDSFISDTKELNEQEFNEKYQILEEELSR